MITKTTCSIWCKASEDPNQCEIGILQDDGKTAKILFGSPKAFQMAIEHLKKLGEDFFKQRDNNGKT